NSCKFSIEYSGHAPDLVATKPDNKVAFSRAVCTGSPDSLEARKAAKNASPLPTVLIIFIFFAPYSINSFPEKYTDPDAPLVRIISLTEENFSRIEERADFILVLSNPNHSE